MQNSILIKKVKVVNEGTVLLKDVLIKNGLFERIADTIELSDFKGTVIQGEGNHLLPGIIDDQVHFREPGLTHKATIATESKAAIAGGITSFIEMPNTNPQTTTISKLEEKFDTAKASSFANYSFMFGGTNNNLEEIKKLNPKKVAALKLFLGSSTGNMLVDDPEVLEKIFRSTNLVIAVHCEDEDTIRANTKEYLAKYGENIPIEAHPKIRSEAACYISSSNAVALAKKTGARLHVFHISTAKELSLFSNELPLKEKQITAEVCLHHLWFCDEDYKEKGTLIKWNPAVKTATDQKALLAGLINDQLDVLATDHAPHTLEEKKNVYTKAPSGGPLVQHALNGMLEFYQQGKIELSKIVEKMCHNPAILFAIEKRGYIKEGFYADCVLVDLDKTTTVKREDLLYKCQWSPFEGTTFRSKITHTFLNGTIAYENGTFAPRGSAMRLTFDR